MWKCDAISTSHLFPMYHFIILRKVTALAQGNTTIGKEYNLNIPYILKGACSYLNYSLLDY